MKKASVYFAQTQMNTKSDEQEKYTTQRRSQRIGTGGNRSNAVVEWACE